MVCGNEHSPEFGDARDKGVFMKRMLSLMTAVIATGLMANPTDGTFVSGSGSINDMDPSNITVSVNGMSTTRAVIEWDTFSIGSDETTTFTLPTTDSAILNRVTGSLMTDIEGTLSSNGIVYLINENGIVLGDNAVLDVPSLLASTLYFSDSDFLGGGNISMVDNTQESIVHSSVTHLDGDIYLLGYQVTHEGFLTSDNGVVSLAAAGGMVVHPSSDQRIEISIQSGNNSVDKGVDLVVNSEIHAPRVEVKADGTVYAIGVYQEGIILSHGTGSVSSRVILYGQEGATESNGPITVLNSNGTGGEIQVIGDTVLIDDSSFLNASGSSSPSQGGGGNIYIGGGYEGSNSSIPNATTTTVSADAFIQANSGTINNAGLIVVWSDDTTTFHGQATAEGGSVSGDGGTIEIYGQNSFSFDGITDVSSPHGTDGQVIFN